MLYLEMHAFPDASLHPEMHMRFQTHVSTESVPVPVVLHLLQQRQWWQASTDGRWWRWWGWLWQTAVEALAVLFGGAAVGGIWRRPGTAAAQHGGGAAGQQQLSGTPSWLVVSAPEEVSNARGRLRIYVKMEANLH